MPSNWPPIRSIAARLLALRASVFSVTRSDRHSSKACRSRSSLQAVFTCVRCAHDAYQVAPISATVGGCSSDGSGPGARPGGHGDGQAKTSKVKEARRPGDVARAEVTHRERDLPAGVPRGERQLRVGTRLGRAVRHPGVPVAVPVPCRRLGEALRMAEGQRLKPDPVSLKRELD